MKDMNAGNMNIKLIIFVCLHIYFILNKPNEIITAIKQLNEITSNDRVQTAIIGPIKYG